MEKTPRKTQFWSFQTPSKLGPGSYQLSLQKPLQNLPAPFALGQKRNLTLITNQTFPGPGSYNTPSPTLPKRGRIASKSPRSSPFPVRQLNPGPGHYSPVPFKHKIPQSDPRRALSLTVDPTPISIPTKITQQRQVGPGTYTPNLSVVKPSSVQTAFGNYSVFRTVQQSFCSPGPGTYNLNTVGKNLKKNWYFSSQQSRMAEKKNVFPGPGHYGGEKEEFGVKIRLDSFGSSSQRDIPLSNDPHRPFVTLKNYSPPVGYYFNKEQLSRIDQLREKFIVFPKGEQKRPRFGSSDGRFNKFSAFFVPEDLMVNRASPALSDTRFM